MPSKSKKQAKLMSAVAHNPEFAHKVSIPQSVGKDFNDADQARKAEDDGMYVKGSDGRWWPRRIPSDAQLKNNQCTTCGFIQAPADRAKNGAGCDGGKAHTWPIVQKFDMVEITPDGKQELVTGKEPLAKDPKKRWKALKKALDHQKAFMDLEEAMGDDEEQSPEESAEQPQQQQPEAQQEEATDPQEQPAADGGEEEQAQPEPEQQDPASQDGADSEAVSPPPEEGEEQPEEQEDPEEGNGDAEPDPQELIDALKEEGYSDQEIAYIMHGQHAGDVDETKAAKADATRAMSDIDIQNALKQAEIEHSHNEQSLAAEREHKKRMQDLEYEQAQKKHALVDQDAAHKQRMSDIEYQQAQQANPQALEQEHKKRMLDLEYEKAKKEASSSDGTEGDAEANKQMKMLEVEKKKLELQLRKEEMKLELEFKKREHDLKLKMMEAQLKEQAKQKQEIGGIKHEQRLKEAKNPPKKPLKKSEEADDEGRDQ